jgi:hypothetical protein
VWYARNKDGSYTVALFNLADTAASVTADWSDVGFTGTGAVRDVWSHTNLGRVVDGFTTQLPPHGSRLLTVRPVAHHR